MQIVLSSQFQKSFQNLVKRNDTLRKKIINKVELFKVSPNHPSLRLHKLSGKYKNVWSISVDMNIRILIIYDKDRVVFVEIGGHNKVY